MNEEVAQQQSPEDLSKLKGPSWWWPMLMLMAVAAIVRMLWYYGLDGVLPFWEAGLALIALASFVHALGRWSARNRIGHTVRWWKDGDTWRVTAQGYPEKAEGPVIEVHVKARPSFRFLFGNKRWQRFSGSYSRYTRFGTADGTISFDNSMALRYAREGKLLEHGITEEVLNLLYNTKKWTIIPLDAGRVLRFVDRFNRGIEVHYTELEGVDLEEILRSKDCASYHKWMQDKARENKIVMQQAGEAIVKLGLPFPSESGHLLYRMGELQKAAEQVRDARDQAWRQLCRALAILRKETAKYAARTKSKLHLEALLNEQGLLAYLQRQLPTDSPLRTEFNISQDELIRVEVASGKVAIQLAKAGTTAEQGG